MILRLSWFTPGVVNPNDGLAERPYITILNTSSSATQCLKQLEGLNAVLIYLYQLPSLGMVTWEIPRTAIVLD